MPLTKRPPPQPVRTLHEAEVQQYSATWSEYVYKAVQYLVWSIWYPHVSFRRGVGQSASSSGVTGTVEASDLVTSTPLGTQWKTTTSQSFTTSRVRGKQILVAITSALDTPERRADTGTPRVIDLLRSLVAASAPRPPPVIQPSQPPPGFKPSTFQQHARSHGTFVANLIRWWIAHRHREEFWSTTRFWWGVGVSINTTAKTADVRLDPFPASSGSEVQTFGWGTRQWSRAQIVGKALRVAYDPIIGRYIDDWA